MMLMRIMSFKLMLKSRVGRPKPDFNWYLLTYFECKRSRQLKDLLLNSVVTLGCFEQVVVS